MSLLLDALKRAGRERAGDADAPAQPVQPARGSGGDTTGEAERTRAQQVLRGQGTAGRRMPVLGLVVVAVVLLVGVLLAGGWYYVNGLGADVDRSLARYQPAPISPPARTHDAAASSDTRTDTTSKAAQSIARTDAASTPARTTGADDADSPTRSAAASSATPAADHKPEPEPKPKTKPEKTAETTSGPGSKTASTTTAPAEPAPKPTATRAHDQPQATTQPDSQPSRQGDAQHAVTRTASTGDRDDDDEAHSADNGHNTIRRSRSNPLTQELRAGYRALQAGDLAAAQRHYQRVLARAPSNRDAALGAAAVAVQQQRPRDAARLYQRVLDGHPDDPYAEAGLAALDIDGRSPEQRIRRLQTRLRAHPDMPDLRFALGNLYAREGQWAKAQKAYFEAFKTRPQRPRYAFNLAVALDHLGERDSARRYYRRALDGLDDNDQAGFPVTAARHRLQALTP